MAHRSKRGKGGEEELPVCDTDQPDGKKKGQKVCRLPHPAPPAQEWGQRHETGKAIARGGKSTGHVPGATEQASSKPMDETQRK